MDTSSDGNNETMYPEMKGAVKDEVLPVRRYNDPREILWCMGSFLWMEMHYLWRDIRSSDCGKSSCPEATELPIPRPCA